MSSNSVPVIALVGRPNVGKSTLFNRLTGTMNALVVDEPGVTRDRQWGQGEWEERPYIVIDTGGIIERPSDNIETAMLKQSRQALNECDVIFFVLDARSGLTAFDQMLARLERNEADGILSALMIDQDGCNMTIHTASDVARNCHLS